MRGFVVRVCLPLLYGSGWGFAQSLPSVTVEAPAMRILKGELLEWNVRGLSGDLLIEDDDGPRRWRCKVTSDTFLSRSDIRIHPAGVRIGDRLEIVGETAGGPSEWCVARTVYVRGVDPKRRTPRQSWSSMSTFLDGLWPRGLLTFSGVVNRIDGNRLYLRTRKFGAKSFALRDDTAFSSGGRPVDLAALVNQTRVFVRASRTYEGDLEVYHVVWGDILMTRDGH